MIKDIMHTKHSGDEKANKLIHKYLNKYQRTQIYTPLKKPAWQAEFFLLNQSTLYNQLKEEQQQQVLHLCAQGLLLDSYGIEKIGISYCGKLANIAPSMEERQMFSLIGADEATHLQWLTPYIPESLRTQHLSPFLALMDQVIVLDNANMLYYLVQILLEGWSIKHYKALYDHCADEGLKKIIKNTLRDESMHHHTGKTFFNAAKLSDSDKKLILDRLKGYCELMRTGPYQVVQAMEQVLGELSKQDKITLLEELNTQDTCHFKLQMFKQLMLQPGLESLVQQLIDEEYFEAIKLEQSAARC
jgi:rubrerythrin